VTRRFRLTAPIPTERELHKAVARLLDALLAPPALWFTYPAGASTLSPQQAARHTEVGLKRGLPDIWLLHRSVYCIELKRAKGGAISKTRTVRTRSGALRIVLGQAEVFPALIATGAVREIAICRSVDDVMTCLQRWQIPLRRSPAGASSSMPSAATATVSKSSSTTTATPRRPRASASIAR
jgi:hypothetical protein